jgi:acetylornithine deacetylase/succinyl-diaminopimelate desuccinylase-like protein
MYLDNVWRPNLSITGAGGIPALTKAGNVVRAKTTVRVSLRVSPDFDAEKAKETLVNLFTTNVPYNAKVTILTAHAGNGFCMKVLQPWLQNSIQEAGSGFYGKPSGSYGDGGSIPFLNELSQKYPESQVVAFGVLGPFSNAHGPNEFLELAYTKKLTCALSHVLASCGQSV